MNLGFKNIARGFFTDFIKFQYTPVRYRYYAEKIAAGPKPYKYGYNETTFTGGILPRLKDAKKHPISPYKPGNSWTKEKCTFGQNDYIDILGGGKLKPYNVCYEVPKWMRGVQGNEMQLLLLKKKYLFKTRYPHEQPKNWDNINKRIRFLYKYLNLKTKTGLSKD